MTQTHLLASSLASVACCALIPGILPKADGALTNRWSFNNPAAGAPFGSSITDSVGNAAAAVVGNGAVFDGSSLVLPGSSTGNQPPATIAAYVDLPNGLISSKTHLTIEIWATPVSVKNWQRLFDFGRMGSLSQEARGGGLSGEIQPAATQAPNNASSSDDLAFAFHRNGAANTQRLMARLDGAGELASNSETTLVNGNPCHFVCTFTDGAGSYGSGGGQLAWFLNGTQISTLDVNFHLSSLQDRNNWLGRSMYSADSNANIAYDEVRLYDHALTPVEIADSLAAGPDQLGSPLPIPDHLWTFTTQAQSEAPSGTIFTDSIGSEIATLRGVGGALDGRAVILPGSSTGNQPAAAISAYLDLPNGIVSRSASVSFEAWASPLSSKNWQRLFDFGNCTTTHGSGAASGEILDTNVAPGATSAWDNLSLTFNNGGNLNSQQLEGEYDDNGALYSFSTAATTPGVTYHYVLVVEDAAGSFGPNGCQARWYRNGTLQNSMDFPFHIQDMEDVNNWIGRSMYSGDSNAHLSLDELRIYRRAITAGEILSSFTAGPDPAVGPPEPPVPAPLPSRRWSFNSPAGNAAAGTAFPDAAVGEIATVRGNQATLSGTQLVLPTTATTGNQPAAAISAYLDLPNGIVSSRPSVSVEAWVTPLGSKNWQRLFDFGSTSLTHGAGAQPGEIIDDASAPGAFVAQDNLFLSLNNGGTLGSHRLEAKLGGASTYTSNTDYSASTSQGTEFHYVLTVQDGGGAGGASGCLVKWFRNGVLSGSIDLPYRLPNLHDVNNWVGRSMWAADSNASLSINELRIYDRSLSAAEIRSSLAAGPDTVFPPPIAHADEATIHPGQKVLIDVLANDSGDTLPGTLQISSPPAVGNAAVSNGKILYSHSGSSATPATFTYRVGNVSGSATEASVTIQFSTALRLNNPQWAMPDAPPATSLTLVDALPGLTFSRPIGLVGMPGDNEQLFVCEQGGLIKRVGDVTSLTPTASEFLDLAEASADFNIGPALAGHPENGLLGMAFHPDYASNGYLYVAYTANIAGSYYQRVARFSRDAANPTIADPDSELILLQIADFGLNHNGGDLHFGPTDGYLYYGTGDGENSTAGQARSQKINGDFFSGIFRMDVDKRPGSLPPTPHASIPTDAGAARFHVPPDNPFIHHSLGGDWNGIYNGVDYSTSLGSIRTEYWATGIRHAWRMSFDPPTGDLWVGDVGQGNYEEINKIQRGGNYGWAWREGAHDYNSTVIDSKPVGWTSSDPIYDYLHNGLGGDASFIGNSVVGGYVYRGSRYPELFGSYIFCDSVSGHVWQMDTATGATTRITGLPGQYGVFSSMGTDPANQDILFCAYLRGKIMRLATGSDVSTGFPQTLGATGLFADLTDLSPAPGLLPYTPNLRFWSDFADKTRWFGIPDADSLMTWKQEGPWTYPTGMVWVKHFDLPLTRGNPATRKRIETRVLVKTDTGVYGVSYRWNEAGSEAHLVGDAGDQFDLEINDGGTLRTQRWTIPGRASCLTCHQDRPLSFHNRQLNRVETINGLSGNQIDLLAEGGYLANMPAPVTTLPFHVRPDETAYPLEQRVRSYLDVNCGYCHQAGGSAGGFWDGREQLTLEQTGIIFGSPVQDGGNPANRYIVPGEPLHSIILQRAGATNGWSRMPPLASAEVDQEGLALLTAWINQELPDRPLYPQWRGLHFAAADPLGDKSADPDHDGVSNYDEYLRGSSPVSGSGSWQAVIAGDSLEFLRKSHRYYSIETSGTLDGWQPWPVPELEATYQATDELIRIPLPANPGGSRFFRFRVTEP